MSDGAEVIQGFVDLHCPQALRILDFAHAAERVAALGQALVPSDPTWLPPQLHRLKHAGPDALLADLCSQVAAHPAAPACQEHLSYLEKRLAQLQYPRFLADGWPIGSGVVESANKLVVQARLKGAGMHWNAPTSIPCWRCAMPSATTAGTRPGSVQCRAVSASPHAAAPRHQGVKDK